MKVNPAVFGLKPGSLTSKIVEVAATRPRKGVTAEYVYHKLFKDEALSYADYQVLTGRVSELKRKGILVHMGKYQTLKDTGKKGEVLVLNY